MGAAVETSNLLGWERCPRSLFLSSDFKEQGHMIPSALVCLHMYICDTCVYRLSWDVLMSGFPSWPPVTCQPARLQDFLA